MHARAPLLAAPVFVVLALVGVALYPSAPDAAAPGEEIARFYADNADRIVLVQTIHLLAAAALVTFVCGLRAELVRRAGDGPLVTVVFGASLAAIAVMTVAATMDLVAAARAEERGEIGADAAAVLFDLGVALFSQAAPVLWAPAVLAAGVIALRGTGLPRWLAVPSLLLGVALLVPPIRLPAMIVLHFWALAVAVVLVRDRPADTV
jgi:hypothetical protein